jgi:hypothetical protein
MQTFVAKFCAPSFQERCPVQLKIRAPKRALFLILASHIIAEHPPGVLVVVAVDAKVLPVRAIRRVVAVVAVFVMHSQEMPVLVFELSSAFRAYEAVYFEGLLPVILRGAVSLPQFSHYFFH